MRKNIEKSLETRNEQTEENKKIFLSVFVQKANNIQLTCKALNISRSTFYKWKNEDESFKESVEELEEGEIDNAESALKKQILDGNTTAIIFFLKTKAKSRGYVEHQIITSTNTNINSEVKSPEEIKKMADELDNQY